MQRRVYRYALLSLLSISSGLSWGAAYQGEKGKFIPLGNVSNNYGLLSMFGFGGGNTTGKCYVFAVTQLSQNYYPTNGTYPSYVTLDGYKGFMINNLLYVVYSGTAQAIKNPSNPNAAPSGTVTFDSVGNFSTSGNAYSYSSMPCWYAQKSTGAQWDTSLSINLKVGVYIPKDATLGTVNLVDLYPVNANFASRLLLPKLFNSEDTLKVTSPSLTCSISAPPIINFGTVNLWNFAGNSTGAPGGARRDVLASVDGNLSISCSSDSPGITNDAKLTLKGTTQKYANDLKVVMDSTNNDAPATVRASIFNLYSACSSNGIQFSPSTTDPQSNQVDIGELHVGVNTIPYRFSLCARPESGLTQFGSASTQATITLDWN